MQPRIRLVAFSSIFALAGILGCSSHETNALVDPSNPCPPGQFCAPPTPTPTMTAPMPTATGTTGTTGAGAASPARAISAGKAAAAGYGQTTASIAARGVTAGAARATRATSACRTGAARSTGRASPAGRHGKDSIGAGARCADDGAVDDRDVAGIAADSAGAAYTTETAKPAPTLTASAASPAERSASGRISY